MHVQVVPDWERLTAHIEADPESKEKLGWVREMYAFSVAVALQVSHLGVAPSSEFGLCECLISWITILSIIISAWHCALDDLRGLTMLHSDHEPHRCEL